MTKLIVLTFNSVHQYLQEYGVIINLNLIVKLHRFSLSTAVEGVVKHVQIRSDIKLRKWSL